MPRRRRRRHLVHLEHGALHPHDAAPAASLLYLIVAVASVGGLLFGYDTGVVSGAMIKLTPYFGMNTVMVEATVSSGLPAPRYAAARRTGCSAAASC